MPHGVSRNQKNSISRKGAKNAKFRTEGLSFFVRLAAWRDNGFLIVSRTSACCSLNPQQFAGVLLRETLYPAGIGLLFDGGQALF